jgi:hypothetical protein
MVSALTAMETINASRGIRQFAERPNSRYSAPQEWHVTLVLPFAGNRAGMEVDNESLLVASARG